MAKTKDQWNAQLLEAAEKGELSLVQEALDSGADIDTKGEWGITALMWVSSSSSRTEGTVSTLERWPRNAPVCYWTKVRIGMLGGISRPSFRSRLPLASPEWCDF